MPTSSFLHMLCLHHSLLVRESLKGIARMITAMITVLCMKKTHVSMDKIKETKRVQTARRFTRLSVPQWWRDQVARFYNQTPDRGLYLMISVLQFCEVWGSDRSCGVNMSSWTPLARAKFCISSYGRSGLLFPERARDSNGLIAHVYLGQISSYYIIAHHQLLN